MAKKTACPISRANFSAKAKPVTVTIAGQTLQAGVKQFSTGSFGWYLNGKIDVDIDGTMVPVQIGLNMTIVGSKDLPTEAAAAPAPAAATPP